MGSFTTGTKLYKPALGEVGYDDELNTNFDRLSEFGINVKSYGAVGDGVTDDSGAWIDALAAIPANGGKLIVPPATYLFANEVLISGQHKSIRAHGAIIKTSGSIAGLRITG